MLPEGLSEGLAWSERVPFPVFLTLCVFATVWFMLARAPLIEYMGRRAKPTAQILAERQAELAEKLAELANELNRIQQDALEASKAMDAKFGDNLTFFENTNEILLDILKVMQEAKDELATLNASLGQAAKERRGFWH